MTNRLSLFLAILIMSCTQPSKNTTVSGNIKGLQKGTLYLQHVKDEGFTTLDSLEMTSTTDFQLGCDLDEPEVLFLSLSKELDAERISFFADQGHTTINTTLKRFKYDAQIEGSDQQKLLESYYKNIERFKNQKLELIEAQLNAQKDGNLERSDSLQVKINKIVQRSYLYSINFALNNKDSEVAPFVAVSEIYDANVKYLDTINKVLPPKIANSKYGIILEEYIKTIKSE
ncbi:MAG: DUF4369 domain-containing protein [Flavobacteriaceae bacterium]